jgi:NhaP-type Na+/H+ or K+/H+ antiporter
MSRDMRRHAAQTRRRLTVGLCLIVLVVGGGLIYLMYGPSSAAAAVTCLLGALVPVAVVWLILRLLDWFVKRANRD